MIRLKQPLTALQALNQQIKIKTGTVEVLGCSRSCRALLVVVIFLFRLDSMMGRLTMLRHILLAIVCGLCVNAPTASAIAQAHKGSVAPPTKQAHSGCSFDEGKVSEQFIGEIRHEVKPGLPTASPDNKRFAYVSTDGKTFAAVVDGKLVGSGYDADLTIDFSPDGHRYAYVAHSSRDKFIVVVDGQVVGRDYDGVDDETVSFSPDSSHFAYVVRHKSDDDDTAFVVLDGVAQRSFLDIFHSTFSPDSTHFIYGAKDSGKAFAVLDGREQPKYDAIVSDFSFSPDGARMAYGVELAGKYMVIIDGVQSRPYVGLVDSPIVFSTNNKHVAYGAVVSLQDHTAQVVVDSNGRGKYKSLGSIVFSPDGNRIAFRAGDGGNDFMVVDGIEQTNVGSAFSNAPVFSPDSKRVAYWTKQGQQSVLVVDGKIVGRFERPGTITFSADGKHFAYDGGDSKTWSIFVDGVEHNTHGMVSHISFSPDSKHFGYLRYRDDQSDDLVVVVDGKEYATSCPGQDANLFFSADNKHVVYIVSVLTRFGGYVEYIGVDGIAAKLYDYVYNWNFGRPIIFDSPTQFHYLAEVNSRVYVVRQSLE